MLGKLLLTTSILHVKGDLPSIPDKIKKVTDEVKNFIISNPQLSSQAEILGINLDQGLPIGSLGRPGPGDEVIDFGPSSRNLAVFTEGNLVLEGFSKIRKYGCFCNFVNFRNVHGEAQDDYDSACKRLHDNYLCTIDESSRYDEKTILKDGICRPEVDAYSSNVNIYLAMAIAYKMIGFPSYAEDHLNLAFNYCDTVNQSICMKGACKSEARFIYEIQLDIGMSMVPNKFVKDEFIHTSNGGSFNFDDNCQVQTIDTSPTCCGLVPKASRYNSVGQRDCCLGELYHPFSHCCSNTGIMLIGDC